MFQSSDPQCKMLLTMTMVHLSTEVVHLCSSPLGPQGKSVCQIHAQRLIGAYTLRLCAADQ
jgi:hypothetical protein